MTFVQGVVHLLAGLALVPVAIVLFFGPILAVLEALGWVGRTLRGLIR